MSRAHYLLDRVKISRRVPILNQGIVENDTRVDFSDWIPSRVRIPDGAESQPEDPKIDLPITYELVMWHMDDSGNQVFPRQYDELILKYSRNSVLTGDAPELVETNQRLRIVSTISETRKRSKVYTYVMSVVADTEF